MIKFIIQRISFSTRKYIKKRISELGVDIPNNYIDILKEVQKKEEQKGIHIIFSYLYSQSNHPNANAFLGKSMLLNPEYAVSLILYYNDNCNNDKFRKAFEQTIGHELTHKERYQEKYKQLTPFRLPLKKMKFTAWVNEAHADFGGAQKMANSSRQTLLEVMEYKKAQHPDSKDICHHPSWERRMYYVKKFDFTNELIEQIAKDVGYKNQKFIDKVKAYAYYADIILSPAPAND